VIVEYFIASGKYDVYEIIEVLFSYDQALLGGRDMQFIDNEITLRYAVTSDAEQLTAWWNDGAVMVHAGFPNGLETTIVVTLKSVNNVSDDRRRQFIIEIGGVAVGEMSFRTESAHTAVCRPATLERYDSGKIAEIGIKICREDYQEKGYGTRILRLFTRALFNHYGFDIITLDTNLNNTRSQRVYESVGFERVEVKENAWQSQQTGEWATVVYYEMVRETNP
jgi:RimJ/RimL family protein N-acetyltransferase